ncbi:hypothetical protein SLS62_000179 [Diatrype stigma]|uniref:Uncharacterized protein n=1 Tax=Diatrype stigma TaxID=117547 RepID=A0AAN9V214_9PEZI
MIVTGYKRASCQPPLDLKIAERNAALLEAGYRVVEDFAKQQDDNIEIATERWVSLLFRDAVTQNEDLWNMNFETEGLNIFGNTVAPSPVGSPQPPPPPPNESNDQPAAQVAVGGSPASSNPGLLERNVSLEQDQVLEKQLWQSESTVEILDREHYAFRHFVQHISTWAMHYNTYKTSLELVATSLIISAYEMLDGSSRDWERHLHGVFWIQRSQVIHGDSKGLRQSVWWAWLCQDVFAAYLENRKPFTFWRPVRTLPELDPHELAARSVFYFSQVINYCSVAEIEAGKVDPVTRIARGDMLRESLEQWERHLTVEFRALPLPSTAKDAFQPLWIQPAPFGKGAPSIFFA